VASGAGEQDVIEKIDIGGVSLIRAAAKNFRDVGNRFFTQRNTNNFIDILDVNSGCTTLNDRRAFALRSL
jgi:phosphoribosylaminoimidazolecarboxamide formyltransferase / IMP cyclohydrolase